MSMPAPTMTNKILGENKSLNIQSHASVQILAFHDLETFKNLQEHWALLLQQVKNQTIFLTWEWLFAWKKHLGKQSDLWLITAWSNDILVGIAPLMLTKTIRHGIQLNLLCNLGSPHIDTGGFIVKDNDSQIHLALCNYLISRKKEWDLLELNEVDTHNGGIDLVKSFFKKSGFSIFTTDNRHFYIDTSGDWKSYFQQLPKKNRHEFRRKAKHVEISACTKFVRHIGQNVTHEDMATMFSINKCGHFPGFYQPCEEQEFQHELLRHMAKKGWLDISFLYLDDEPAAFCYGYIYNEQLEIWRIGFDTKHHYLSPGIVLMNWVLEDSFQQNIRKVDFLRGEESYKEQWKPQSCTFSQLRIVSTSKPKPLIMTIGLPFLSKYINEQHDQFFSLIHHKQNSKKVITDN